ncbi:hypothetical protein [Paenibacillus alkalitolerans]|uniref:hypothetical protein n=1 Tax=Paenibacillus alkalitolerans TaxID=2799335 RepID=UPI0018F7A2A9|nr:hypothetical protein [Paenibacillus alkalitolerans]
MEETLIEKLKQFYFDYRQTADPEESFSLAMQTMPHFVLHTAGHMADENDLEGIRSIIRQYEEFSIAPEGSNDSVQERFENEFREARRKSLEPVQ